MRGIVFDIKEFALHDGAGIRTTVFLKGCPLRCIWCHNPEGLRTAPELSVKSNGCLHCDLCRKPCTHAECRPFGRCLHICPMGLIDVVGVSWESDALAEKLLASEDFFRSVGGGVTFSGGEPLLQADFCLDVIQRLHGRIHTAIETCGYAEKETFCRVIDACDFVMMDLKLADPQRHLDATGVRNEKILANAAALQASGKPHLFRIPLIPGITDDRENLAALAAIAGESPVELLPYNTLAPAKYANVGRSFPDRIDLEAAQEPDLSLFHRATLRKK